MAETILIANRKIGHNCPCFVIAEAGVNHNGELEIAKQLVDAAAASGADAVKFQTFQADQLISAAAPKAEYQQKTTDNKESQLEMVRRLELSADEFRVLHKYCKEKKIIFLSTPFDEGSVDLLDQLGVPAFKVGSGEITNWFLLEYIARKGKPILLSTGMSSLKEVDEALQVILKTGNNQVCLLHCVSDYPAKPEDVNLRALQTMREAFGFPIGYSDHTQGIEVALAAVAMGACVVEKHFTLDKTMEGPDHQASLDPEDLLAMVAGIRKVERSLGHGRKEPTESELHTAKAARRSLVAAQNISRGTILKREHIAIKRPGTGLPPRMLEKIIGLKAKEDIPADSLIQLEKLS